MGESGGWFAFTAAGEPGGYLPIPQGSKLLSLWNGHLLVEERDDLGVPYAVLYALTARGSGS